MSASVVNLCVCGAELWGSGENGNGGEWVEPVQGEDVL